MTTRTNDAARPTSRGIIRTVYISLRNLFGPRRKPEDPPRLPPSPLRPPPREDSRIPFVCGNDVFTRVPEYREIERHRTHPPSVEAALPPIPDPDLPPFEELDPPVVSLWPPLSSYIPEMHHAVKVVCINLHIFRDSNGQGHYQETEMDRLDLVMAWVNWWFADVGEPSDEPNPPARLIRDTRIRFKVNRVEFYDNDALHVSTSVSNLQSAALARNPSTLDQLNVYLTMGKMLDASGFAVLPSAVSGFDSWVVLLGSYHPTDDWGRVGSFCHELGHALDLYHTYIGGGASADCTQGPEFLYDVFGTAPSTCPHGGAWGDPVGPVDPKDPWSNNPKVTNNLMGGNKEGRWLSALQAARMHRALTDKSVKRYVATGCRDCLGCIAFTVHGAGHVSSSYQPVKLVYSTAVPLNEGWGWNNEDFIAPARGIYHFDLSFLKDALQNGGTEDDVFVDVEKFENGSWTLLGTAWSGEQAGKRGTGCVSVNVRLKAGDRVSTRIRSEGGFKLHLKLYTFAGHRICSC